MSTPRFERGAHIAWMIDAERGYRVASASDWEIVAIETLPGGRRRAMASQRIRLVDVIGENANVPEITLEPSTDPEKIIVVSSADLVVQEYGDTTPRTAGDAVEVCKERAAPRL